MALFLMFIICFSVNAQVIPTDSVSLKQDYLQKSLSKKKTGWIMFGTGAALVLSGLILANGDESSFSQSATGALMTIGGGGLVVTSAFFFSSAQSYKKKALLLSLQMERARSIYLTTITNRHYPSIQISLSF